MSEEDRARRVARGEFGRDRAIRPAHGGHTPARCLRGHELAVARARNSYHHLYGMDEITCLVCSALGDPRASWCLVGPARLHTDDTAPALGLALVRQPPVAHRGRGGVGQVQLRIDGQTLGDLDLAVCVPCRRAVLEQVRVDQPYRRRGYGRTLLAAALELAPPVDSYRWSTTTIADDPITRAFWAAVTFPGQLGAPAYCTDMLLIREIAPDA